MFGKDKYFINALNKESCDRLFECFDIARVRDKAKIRVLDIYGRDDKDTMYIIVIKANKKDIGIVTREFNKSEKYAILQHKFSRFIWDILEIM